MPKPRRRRAFRPGLDTAMPLEPRLAPSGWLSEVFGPLVGQSSTDTVDLNARPFWEKWDDNTDPLNPPEVKTRTPEQRAANRARKAKAAERRQQARAATKATLLAKPKLKAAALSQAAAQAAGSAD